VNKTISITEKAELEEGEEPLFEVESTIVVSGLIEIGGSDVPIPSAFI
jgi:hypothetical protein